MNVFVSHSGVDNKWAERFRAGLCHAGFEVWDPASDLPPGTNYHLELGKALERSDAMIVLLSPDSVKSPSVLSEIDYALSSPQFRDRLISVLLRPTREIPWILQKLQHIRATKDVSQTVDRVVAALEKSPVTTSR